MYDSFSLPIPIPILPFSSLGGQSVWMTTRGCLPLRCPVGFGSWEASQEIRSWEEREVKPGCIRRLPPGAAALCRAGADGGRAAAFAVGPLSVSGDLARTFTNGPLSNAPQLSGVCQDVDRYRG